MTLVLVPSAPLKPSWRSALLPNPHSVPLELSANVKSLPATTWHLRWRRTRRVGSIAELALSVAAPGPDGAVVPQRGDVPAARGNRNNPGGDYDLHGRGRTWGVAQTGGQRIGRRTEHPSGVVAPAPQSSVRTQGQRVLAVCGNLLDAVQTGHLDR